MQMYIHTYTYILLSSLLYGLCGGRLHQAPQLPIIKAKALLQLSRVKAPGRPEVAVFATGPGGVSKC